MRGRSSPQELMFFSTTLEEIVPPGHPLHEIRRRVNEALASMSDLFDTMYSKTGNPSIPPEQLLKAQLLRVLYTIRSDIQLCDQLTCNFRYRWFVGLQPNDRVWTPEVFSMNRKRFDAAGIHMGLLAALVDQMQEEGLVDTNHFAIDGTLLKAYGSTKSLRPLAERHDDDEPPMVGGPDSDDPSNPTIDFHHEKRCNDTHQSISDPMARIAHKNGTSQLSHLMNAAVDCKNGLVVAVDLRAPSGTAERDAVPELLDQIESHGMQPTALAADRGYDDGKLLLELERRGVQPCIAMRKTPATASTPQAEARRRSKQSEADRERTEAGRQRGHLLRFRKRIEEVFGHSKTIGGLGKLMWPRLREKPGITTRRTGDGRGAHGPPADVACQHVLLAAVGYNLVRMANLARV